MKDDNAAASADHPNPESRARETIADLLGGRVAPKTVRDLGTAVDRAKSDQAVSRNLRAGV